MKKSLKVAALLTGRGGSTLKNKNVLPVLGKPLLSYPALAAKRCAGIADFYCSSDDSLILREAEKCGYRSIVRPPELARPEARHVDAIRHALSAMRNDGCEPDVLVVLLANNGIVRTEWIEESISAIEEDRRISAVVPVMREMDRHPYRCKRIGADGFLESWFDFSQMDVSTNRQDLPANYVLCHNFWTLNVRESVRSEMGGQKPWSFMGNAVKPLVVEESFDVHEMDDIARTEKWLLTNGNGGGIV